MLNMKLINTILKNIKLFIFKNKLERHLKTKLITIKELMVKLDERDNNTHIVKDTDIKDIINKLKKIDKNIDYKSF